MPFYVTNDTIKSALEAFGKVEKITREKWSVGSFIGIESTRSTVRMALKEGVTVDDLPHQLRLFYGNVLVVAPGRPLMCLRCRKTGTYEKTAECQGATTVDASGTQRMTV